MPETGVNHYAEKTSKKEKENHEEKEGNEEKSRPTGQKNHEEKNDQKESYEKIDSPEIRPGFRFPWS